MAVPCPTICASGGFPALPKKNCAQPFNSNAGISQFLYADCEAVNAILAAGEDAFLEDNEINPDIWLPLFQACKIRVTNLVTGQKAKGTATKEKFSSCQPEIVTGRDFVVSYQDKNSFYRNNAGHLLYNYAAELAKNGQLYVGWFTCNDEDQFYGFYPASIDADEVIGEDSKTSKLFEVEITIQRAGSDMLVPDLIKGLKAMANTWQNWQCSNGTYGSDGVLLADLIS